MPHAAELERRRASRNPTTLGRLRKVCLAYPEAVEVEQFGEPWFKAGKKAFCVYGGPDGADGAAFSVSLLDQSELTRDPRFTPTPYVGQHGWTTMAFGAKPDWKTVEELVDIAYRRVANQRMLRALDGDAGAAPAAGRALSPRRR